MTSWSERLSTITGPVRVMWAAAAGLSAGLAALPLQGMARGLVGWCVGAVVFLALSWWLAATFDAKRCRARAQSMDDPNVLILVIMLAIAAVSVGVIVMMLHEVRKLEDVERAAHIALSVVSLSFAWLLIHTVYAFHYAHRYYQEENNDQTSVAGLDFPGKRDPDYLDFLYYSFVVGMTCQVSDVQVTSREMRRLTLVHSVLSFAFNMLVLALSINVVASTICRSRVRCG
jgi:uncharacterized membrane protein